LRHRLQHASAFAKTNQPMIAVAVDINSVAGPALQQRAHGGLGVGEADPTRFGIQPCA
jgi:hypothetical protein